MNEFESFGLQKVILQALDKIGFTAPTPIQQEAIPIAMEGKDILGTAGTGTGKTGAFGLPLISHVMKNTDDIALVMLPTRELAVQVMNSLRDFIGVDRSFRPALLIGGQEIRRQLNQLKYEPRLIVGTPGRIADHIKRRKIDTDKIRFLVLDEMDRMLDMGFGKQIDSIVRHLPKQRQTLLFSATLPKDILELTDKYLINPERVSVGSVTEPAKNIKQETLYLARNECFDALLAQVEKREGSIIIFVNTKSYADVIAKRLKDELGETTAALHGDLKHTQRARVINSFRHEEVRILVATDIAARGLDIPHIEHVINYDLPNVPEDYIHRIGRTGRAEKEGEAVNLVTPADNRRWRAICQLISPDDVKTLLEMEQAENSIGESGEARRGGRNRSSFRDRSREGGRSRGGDRRPRRDGEHGGDRGERRERRPEGRFEGRSEGRFERKREFNRDNRFEGRSEGRREHNSEGRFEGRRSEGRDERRFEGRPDRHSDRHSEGRFEGRREERFARRGEGRFERGRSHSRDDFRSERPSRGHDDKRQDWQPDRPQRDSSFRDRNFRNDDYSDNGGTKENGKSRMGIKRQYSHDNFEGLQVTERKAPKVKSAKKHHGDDKKGGKYLTRKSSKPSKPSRAERTKQNSASAGKSEFGFKRVKRAHA